MVLNRITVFLSSCFTALALAVVCAGSGAIAADGDGGTYAVSGDEGLLSNLFPSVENRFTAVSVALRDHRSTRQFSGSSDIAVVHIAGDGNNGFLVTVLDKTDGQQRHVHFPADSFIPYDDEDGGRYEVNVAEGMKNFSYRLYDTGEGDFHDVRTGYSDAGSAGDKKTDGSPYGSPDYRYATVLQFSERQSGLTAYFAFGARTPASGIPSAGSAVYEGWLSVWAPAADDSEEYRYGGDLTLKADFADGSVSGAVDGMSSRVKDGRNSKMPEGNRIEISNGRIAGGQLSAEWKGEGPEGTPLQTMRGFSGTLTGIFHGPAAEELAGVLEGRREAGEANDDAPAQVAIGEFVSKGEKALETASDIVGSDPAPTYAVPGQAGFLSNLFPSGKNRFTGVSQALRQDWSAREATASRDIAVLHVAGDGDNGFMVTVMDKTDGKKHHVHFPADSFVPNEGGVGGKYEVNIAEGLKDFRYRLYGRHGDFNDVNGDVDSTADKWNDGAPYGSHRRHYTTVFEFTEDNSGLRAFFAFGARTPAGGLPNSGSAVYSGWLNVTVPFADLLNDYNYGGRLRLEADFSDGSVSGAVTDMEWNSRDTNWQNSDMPDDSRIAIMNGRIADGEFGAEWEGHGSQGEPQETLLGFSGTLTGIFHGPAAEELAGVLKGRREAGEANDDAPAQVAIGEFIARRGDVSVEPAELLADLLPSGNHTFPAVSAALREDDEAEDAGILDGFMVQHVASDGKGGFNVTIVSAQDAAQRTVHFPADSFVAYDDGDGGEFRVYSAEGLYRYRFRLSARNGDFRDSEKTDGSSRHAYATVLKFAEDNSGLQAFFTFGPRTPAGGLPNAGSAVYRGSLDLRAPAADLSAEYRYDGQLSLTADFADGSVSGSVEDMESRVSGGSMSDMPDGNRIEISNGKLTAGQISAEWEGEGPEGFLLETMRGLSGSLSGTFHGPAGEELAGVLEGRRAAGAASASEPAQVAIGQFVAERGRGDAVFLSFSDATTNPREPVYAEADGESLQDSAGIELGVASVSRLRDFRNLRERITEPAEGSAGVRSVSPDGKGGFRVTYVIDGTEHDIDFVRNDDGSYDSVTSDGVEYKFWNGFSDGKYWDSFFTNVDRHHCDDCYFGMQLMAGLETDPDVLRTLGSAEYEGWMWANLLPEDRGHSRNWREIRGDVDLQADFSRGRISGQVDGIDMRASEIENPERDWSELPDSNSIAILDSSINGSRFEARWEGRDSDAESDPDKSVRGFAGGIAGAFFGPAGEEVGGIISGRRIAVGSSPAWNVMGSLNGTRTNNE